MTTCTHSHTHSYTDDRGCDTRGHLLIEIQSIAHSHFLEWCVFSFLHEGCRRGFAVRGTWTCLRQPLLISCVKEGAGAVFWGGWRRANQGCCWCVKGPVQGSRLNQWDVIIKKEAGHVPVQHGFESEHTFINLLKLVWTVELSPTHWASTDCTWDVPWRFWQSSEAPQQTEGICRQPDRTLFKTTSFAINEDGFHQSWVKGHHPLRTVKAGLCKLTCTNT